jgi:hypothetical protein
MLGLVVLLFVSAFCEETRAVNGLCRDASAGYCCCTSCVLQGEVQPVCVQQLSEPSDSLQRVSPTCQYMAECDCHKVAGLGYEKLNRQRQVTARVRLHTCGCLHASRSCPGRFVSQFYQLFTQ